MTWITQPRFDTAGLTAIARGSGPNVLLLHGVGLRAEAWGAQLNLPAKITAPDMPGHGHSDFGAGMLMEDYIEAALAVLTGLDGPAVVVGHSMGAMLALELATRAPAHVRAVAALNAVFERSEEAALAVQNRAAALDGATVPDPLLTLQRWFGDHASAKRDACESWLTAMSPAAYKSAYCAFAHSKIPSRESLGAISCPALFITGEKDPNSTPDMSRAMAAFTTNGRAMIIEGAAHMMAMTHSDEVNTILTNLITEVTP